MGRLWPRQGSVSASAMVLGGPLLLLKVPVAADVVGVLLMSVANGEGGPRVFQMPMWVQLKMPVVPDWALRVHREEVMVLCDLRVVE